MLGWLSHGSPKSVMMDLLISTAARWCHLTERAACSAVMHLVQQWYQYLVLRTLTAADPLTKAIHPVSLRARTEVKGIQRAKQRKNEKENITKGETERKR